MQLIPTIIQNANTGQVLMLGYTNDEAIEKTRETGLVHFYSRSRNCLWLKGETSGNTLEFVSSRIDCDSDTLLYLAIPAGPTCHTGNISCFDATEVSFDFFTNFARYINQKSTHARPGSYTVKLLEGSKSYLMRKLVEESAEVSEAFIESQANLVDEVADLMYHLTVLMQRADISYTDVYATLQTRTTGDGGKTDPRPVPR
ncbi:bifunctional phosphoribosyl-AMP cyclohydrolase/phosphoribosyl-ATP diphosphatase HisIE [Fusibacter tunisiensis]|uniref:Histidine biosynthesis bifunctional protein HisIE n=1 Tax=Fusibacter tunisiensis TaxID=1008308 RepID=A0ABS2MPS4_9FIRM|nr:bifunctional phosphoribosyl-AMP cyclohydrolase/phosphoribosyl-ATP diphosphatase HisIE [Fusibacter tunisiensis]MBM7561398.1 phosphoribosyl-ATP pyrophosphohydrolase/phosphoribosyl-AMP cyclohydrolase [Fusibacter tunisiensis]